MPDLVFIESMIEGGVNMAYKFPAWNLCANSSDKNKHFVEDFPFYINDTSHCITTI